MFGDEIMNLDSLSPSTKLVIYGCGNAGRKLLKKIRNERKDLKVCAFVDSYKESGDISGLPVVNVRTLKQHFPEATVLVASLFFKEIIQTLDQHGIKSYYIIKKVSRPEVISRTTLSVAIKNALNIHALEKLDDINTNEKSLFIFNVPGDADLESHISKNAVSLSNSMEKNASRVLRCSELGAHDLQTIAADDALESIFIINLHGDSGDFAEFILMTLNTVKQKDIFYHSAPSDYKDMLVIDSARICYLPIPKCASTSTLFLLRSIFEDEFSGTQPHSIKTSRSLFYVKKITDELLRQYKVFTVVRNPYNRLASFYNDYQKQIHDPNSEWSELQKVLQINSFEDFCEYACNCHDTFADQHFKLQSSFIQRADNSLIDLHVIKLENYQKSLGLFLKDTIPTDQLVHLNKSGSKPVDYISKYFSPKLIRLCNEKYEKDFIHFEYNFL